MMKAMMKSMRTGAMKAPSACCTSRANSDGTAGAVAAVTCTILLRHCSYVASQLMIRGQHVYRKGT